MNALPERLAYDHDKFVDRGAQVQLVLDTVRRLLRGELLARRTIIFYGQRGSGKSWLLQELAYQLQDWAQVLSHYLDLQKLVVQMPDQGATVVSDALQAIDRVVTERIGEPAASLAPTSGPDQWATLLVDHVQALPGPLVLLVDHVEEADKTLLETLEAHLLAPLSNAIQALLVLAGRGRGYPWKSPELRLRAQHWDLETFSLPDTHSQIARQIPASVPTAQEVQELSAGYPWTNYLLARSASAEWAQVLDQIADQMLAGYTELRPYLEALCVLRAFDEPRMPELLESYKDGWPDQRWDHLACRRIRERLTRAALIRWRQEAGGYVIDEALRPILEKGLLLRDGELWYALHCAALCLFRDWVQRYSRSGDRWQAEAEYHAARLSEAGFDPDDCAHLPAQKQEGLL